MKKYVNPSLRVIEVDNSIIATSARLGFKSGDNTTGGDKQGMMYFDFEDEEF